ncbi:MAG: 16S rRNA (guanine(527)-N(7))-methyltransferase RsmG [Clostridia bacterium]|nr:16S rRNA (guanine(527)-N(7))-methyltransferase RsmG [Clostridia bacterium]
MGIPITDQQADALLRYRDIVLEANKKFNLTAITDSKDFVIKHIIDSLVAVNEIPKGAKLCDIGAGAGFPSMPLAIARDDVCVTALDSTAKRMLFVAESAKLLEIKNINTIIGRAEEQNSHFNTYDVVTARAVSALPVLLELSLPLLKVGGLFLAYKTDESELISCASALKTLNAKHVHTVFAELPNGDKRAVLVFEKVAKTPPQYPRTYGAIKKKPL